MKITLLKKIPIGAGLGGGSSDSAAAILALNKIWNVNADKKELETFAASLGADVPFFLTGGTAKAEGIGDIIEKIDSKEKYFFVLVKPSFGVSTVYAYSKIKFPLTNSDNFFNRFEDFIFYEYPEIKKIKNVLNALGCPGIMSGSGSTVFALTSSRDESEKIAIKLKQYNWNVWAVSSCEAHNNRGVE